MADQDSLGDQVKQQISDGMRDGMTFPNQRKAVSDWWNDKVGQAKGMWDKYAGSSDVKASESPSSKAGVVVGGAAAAAMPKTVSASTTTPSIKRSAAKRKTAGGGGMGKTFSGGK